MISRRPNVHALLASFLSLTFAITFIGGVLATSAARAQTHEPQKAIVLDENDEVADDAEIDQPETFELTVPHALRNSGYKLRLGEDEVELSKEKLTLTRSHDRQTLSLLDSHERVLATANEYVDEHIFIDLAPKLWRVSLFAGSVDVNGDAFEDILQKSELETISIAIDYRPGPLGARVEAVHLSNDVNVGGGIKSSYESSQIRAGATYELVPFRSPKGLGQTHLLLSLGGFRATHSVEIGDDTVKLRGDSHNFGAFFGAELALPINSFWVIARVSLTYQKITIPLFDFQTQSVQRSAELGGAYAF